MLCSMMIYFSIFIALTPSICAIAILDFIISLLVPLVVVGVEFAGTGGRGLSGVAVETFAECAKEWLIVVCIYLLMFTVCCLLCLPSIHSHRFMLLLFCLYI